MKYLAIGLLVALAFYPLLLTACVRPVLNEDGVGVVIEPLASLTRVKEGERIGREALDALGESQKMLAEGQAALALQLQNDAVRLQAEQAKAITEAQEQFRALEQAILDAKDESAIDWTQVILGALGIGTLGAGGTYVATNGKKKTLAELKAELERMKAAQNGTPA